MSFRKKQRTVLSLRMGGDLEGLVIQIKSISIGEQRAILKALDDDSEVAILDFLVDQLASRIVAWNLTDDSDVPIEPSVAELLDMELSDVTAIVSEWLDVMSGPDDELGKGSSSGSQFPGQPVTMEAL